MPRGGGRDGEDAGRGLLVDTAHVAQFDAGLVSQYGIHANAEDMIRVHQRSFSAALRRANLSQIDGEATAEIKAEDGWRESVGKDLNLADGERVVDVAVRGNALIAVVENELGYTRKEVMGANSDYEAPQLTPDEAVADAEAARDRLIAEQTRALRAESELRLAEHKAEIDAYVAERLAEVRAEADKRVADAAEDATEAKTKPPRSSARRSSTSKRTSRQKPRRSQAKSSSKPTVKGGSGTSTGAGEDKGGAPTPTGEGEGGKE